jgi:hypothetical protein
MKLSARSLAWLLPLFLTACFHRTKPQPVQSLPASTETQPKPQTTMVELPPSVLTLPTQPLETTQTPQTAKPLAKHKRKVKTTAQVAAENSQQASISTPPTPSVSAIGQLSSGNSSDLRQQTANSITAIERGLNGIGRSLNDQQQKTVAQIRAFLKQAKEALASGDVDGASTLAAKAKVLLKELSS